MAPYTMMGMPTNELQITKADLIDALEDELQELRQENVSNTPALMITVHEAKNGLSNIEVSMLNDNKEMMKFDIRSENTQDNKKITMKCSSEGTEVSIAMTYTDKNAVAEVKIKSDETIIELKMTAELKNAQNVTVEGFTQENSVKLNDMTRQEINTLTQTIYTNVIKVLPQKMQLLGINTMGPTLPTM